MPIVNDQVQEQKNKKNVFSYAASMTKFVLKSVFPSYALLQMNRTLGRVRKFYPNEWFSRQIRRNYVVSFLTFILLFGPIALGTLAIRGNREFTLRTGKAISALTQPNRNIAINAKVALLYVKSAINERKFGTVVYYTSVWILFVVLVSNLMVFYFHEIGSQTRKTIKILHKEGIIDREKSNPMVLWTPIGVLIELSGSAPKEVKLNERIWMALNIQVNDWEEDHNLRSLVFFKTSFKLKARYEYVLPRKG
jgi:hypothetical protein